MTFEETAYKERVLFANINQYRNAQSRNLTDQLAKEGNRQDYSQQVKHIDPLIKFKATHSNHFTTHGVTNQMGLVRKNIKGRQSINDPAKVTSQWVKDGGKITLQEGLTSMGDNSYKIASPATTENTTATPPKAPSLRNRNNGRYPRQLQNSNQALLKGAGRRY